MTSNQRPTYSSNQISRYFDRLKLPEGQRQYDVAGLVPEHALAYLALLQKLHLVAIPFENLTLHYSPHRQISLHPDELFKKIIGDDNGRGGYCMENNNLFGTLLRSLGFILFSAGARVFDNGRWSGWGHMINIVRIGDMKYHVDVGFGGNGPIVPMPLDRTGKSQPHVAPAAARLQWRNIDPNTDDDQRLWVLEHRIDGDSEFQTVYCFTELEFLPSDFWVMNYYTSTSPRTFFTRVLIGEKKILGDDGELIGSVILGNDSLKRRVNGKKELEINFASEDDRIQAIAEHFGIGFSEAERDGVQGLPSQIRSNTTLIS